MIDRKVIEREVETARIALKSYQEGAIIQEMVLRMFEKWLKKYPEKEKGLNKSNGIG